ncbi:hypothetical protein, variant [Blastomyces dermatitidis ATCC 26199]|nr:hypothetical protein BDFG_03960 [Blastomyces dermatitidis ATCC 26199]EQL34039.1 hypothetical protein, variant [Blastomyces dermatitidis ATCC 26199]
MKLPRDGARPKQARPAHCTQAPAICHHRPDRQPARQPPPNDTYLQLCQSYLLPEFFFVWSHYPLLVGHYWTLKQHHPCSAVTQIRILQAPYKRREENDVAILIEMDPWTGPTTVTPKKYHHCASSVAAFVCDDGGGQDLMASRQPYLDGFHHFKLGRWWGKQV